MPYQRILTTLLLIAFLSSCAPFPTSTPPPMVTVTHTPELASATSLPLPTTTPAPILPVNRFEPIPSLAPITLENVSMLESVATYSEGWLIQVNVPKAQDRVVVIYDTGVQVYDLPSLAPRPFLPADLNWSSHSLSPNGKYLAMRNINTNNRIQIWNLDTQEKTCTFEFPGTIKDAGWPVLMEFFSETNQFLFRGILENQDGTGAYQIQFFDLNDCRNVFAVPSDFRTAFSVSPDGRHVAYLENEQVTVLQVEDNTKSSFGDSGQILGVGFTADNQSVIISYPYKIKIYDLVSGEIISESEISNGKDNVYIYALDDGRRILIAWETNNLVLDTETNTSFSLGDEFITDDRELFDDFNGALVTWKSVWNLEKKNRVPLTEYPYGREFSALSQDATFLAVTSGYAPYQTNLLDATTGRMITSLPGENAPIAVNGETFITSGNGQIFVRNFSDGELLHTLEGEYMDGIPLQEEQVLIWQAAGNIALLDVGQGRVIQQTTLPILPLDYDKGLDHYFYQHNFSAWEDGLGFDPSDWLASEGRDTSAISPDHTIGIQQSGDRVQIFSITRDTFFPATENLLASYFLKGGWVRLKFSSDGKLIVGFTYSQMLIWDSQTGNSWLSDTDAGFSTSLQSRFLEFRLLPNGSRKTYCKK